MELLIDCLDMIDKEIKILVKPHPLMPIKESDYPELNFQVTLSPLSELALQYSIAFTSNSTAAAVDIYLAKKKVLIMHSCSTFNMSPLRGYEGVEFVKTAQELAACLSEFTNDPTMFINKNFFYLDNELPKWKKLLNI
jgi:surface carbohydrate biosynthesis protein (TIGR04326 family)